jgi:hypothetical protein
MPETIPHFVGNTSPSLFDVIRVEPGGNPFDLTGSTVTFNMRPERSAVTKVSSLAAVVAALTGEVRYDWIAGDVDTAGEFNAWWSVLLPGGKTQDTPEFTIAMLAHAPLAKGLCELEDVLAYAPGYESDDTTNALLEQLIAAESAWIQRRTKREYVGPVGSTIRRYDLGEWSSDPFDAFYVAEREVDIDPLATAAGLVVRVIAADGVTVSQTVASTDYTLHPRNRDTFTPYDSIEFIRAGPSPAVLSSTGILELESPSWGWQAVPPDIVQACAKRVLLRYLTDAAGAGTALAAALVGVNVDGLLASSSEVLSDHRVPTIA